MPRWHQALFATVFAVAALTGMSCAQAQAALPSTGLRAVTTYESAGLYWSAPGGTAGCQVKFRRIGETAWKDGLDLWFDARNNECRGSIVNLVPDTSYETNFNLPGQAASKALIFKTWANAMPVARTVTVAAGSNTLNITEGGTAAGYVVYDGNGATLDAANGKTNNITVNASYVIVRRFVLKGAIQDAIRISPNVKDVIIEDNEITDWGRLRTGSWGVDMDSAIRAVCSTPTLERVTIQRNKIHNPRYGSNSWSDGHPAGPQGITISYCGGNHVIRWNEIYSSAGKYYNDAIGGEDNFTDTGFPHSDTDIYANRIENTWDDGIEAEGGNKNVRIWGNYINNTATGIATTVVSTGPIYIFRNVWNRARMYEKTALDSDDRQPFFKSGSYAPLGNGRRYLMHNTMLQATQSGTAGTLGGGFGSGGTGSTQLINNTWSKNNIYHTWKAGGAHYQTGTGNEYANDLFSGNAGSAAYTGGMAGTPVYVAGHGWQSESGGNYQLASNSPGFDRGVRINNFNDSFSGSAPDVGASESGSGSMKFGLAAANSGGSTGGTTPTTPTNPAPAPPVAGAPLTTATERMSDLNADGIADILWRDGSNQAAIWLMNGMTATSTPLILGVTPWQMTHTTGDFDGDGRTDILWRHVDGSLAVWLMNGVSATGTAVAASASTYSVTHLADLNGDGRSDLVMRSTDGSTKVSLMNGMAVSSSSVILPAASPWRVTHTGDFNGDKKLDLLLRHTDGSTAVWLMDGTTRLAASATVWQSDAAWTVAVAGDLNGDGKTDLVWKNTTSGDVNVWIMNGAAATSQTMVYTGGLSWMPTHVGDFNDDGRADLVWRNTNGNIAVWLMNGASSMAQAAFSTGDAGWEVQAARDFNRDGKHDLLWRHRDGSVAIWTMNGAAMTAGARIFDGGTTWVPVL